MSNDSRLAEIDRGKNVKTRLLLYVVAATGIVALSILLMHRHTAICYKRYILPSKSALGATKANIQAFAKETSRFPNSLKEISEYHSNRNGVEFDLLPLREYISHSSGNNEEHQILNGTGGWYYNKDTGEVRINLTKPLKHYFKIYFKSDRNEFPSDW